MSTGFGPAHSRIPRADRCGLFVTLLTPSSIVEEAARGRGDGRRKRRRRSWPHRGRLVAEGFGRTCGQIGVLIAMASIIGAALLESGADRIVQSARRVLGERRR